MPRQTKLITISGFAYTSKKWWRVSLIKLPDVHDEWSRRLWQFGPLVLSFSLAVEDDA